MQPRSLPVNPIHHAPFATQNHRKEGKRRFFEEEKGRKEEKRRREKKEGRREERTLASLSRLGLFSEESTVKK